MAAKRKPGRPKKAKADRKSTRLTIRFTEALLGALTASASAGNRSLAAEVEARLWRSFEADKGSKHDG